jgi:hypothetical protein
MHQTSLDDQFPAQYAPLSTSDFQAKTIRIATITLRYMTSARIPTFSQAVFHRRAFALQDLKS